MRGKCLHVAQWTRVQQECQLVAQPQVDPAEGNPAEAAGTPEQFACCMGSNLADLENDRCLTGERRDW